MQTTSNEQWFNNPTGAGNRQAGVSNPEVGQRYRMAGRSGSIGKRYRLAGRLRGRQSGQACGLRDKTGKGKNQEGEKKRDWEKQELRQKC